MTLAVSSSRMKDSPHLLASNFISREDLSELSQKNDGRATFLLGIRGLFHIGVATLGLHVIQNISIPLGLLILAPHMVAMSFLGWAGVGHELFHNSVFTNKNINQFLFKSFSILTWSNYAYFQISHPTHHRQTLGPGDPEGVQAPSISLFDVMLFLSIDFKFFYRRLRVLLLNSLGLVPVGGVGGEMFPMNSAARSALCNGARVVLGVQFCLIVAFVLWKAYWLILIVNIAPFCITFFNRTLAIAQHYGLSEGKGRDYFTSCRTVLLGPVLAFFYANMNYHVEHHFYPSVPFYNLKRLHGLFTSKGAIPHLSKSYCAALVTLADMGLFGRR